MYLYLTLILNNILCILSWVSKLLRKILMKITNTVPTISFWIISIALLLWGLAGASIYIAYFLETPDEFARTAETAVNRDAYAEYVTNIPFWAIAVGICAAVTRLLGAIALLFR